ncbi:hypothetical protein [Blastopirellula marina]|uniref:EF-hand domain-containing protein n=1 Tax=Blastopirellula marina TaxID=124 RepID=A0A2S8GCR0_9BACT|nr:hypothetical protein [Blastopirellula marina]PQO42237.1 hypothetical protein C5Y93_28230 [Blastopirellula marina]
MKTFQLFCAALLLICFGSNLCFAQVGELSGEAVRTYLEEFKKADADQSGLLEKEELATYLESFPDALSQLLSKIPDDSEGVSRDQLLQAATHFKRMKGYDPRTEPNQRQAFDRWDSNGDGKLSADEVKIVLPAELREPLIPKLVTNGSVSFADYLQGFGQFVRAGEVRRTVLSMSPAEELAPADVPSPESLKKKIAAFLTVADAKKKNAQPMEVAEVVEETETEVAEAEENPHAEYFNQLDQDGNGVIEGDEFVNGPSAFRREFGRAGKLTLDDFNQYMERIRTEAARRKASNQVENRYRDYVFQVASGKQTAANARAKVREEVAEEEVAEEEVAEEEVAEEEVAEEEVAQISVESSGTKKDSLHAVTVEVVLLRRKTEKLPQQVLSEEVLAVVGKAGPSLSARLLPWLADEKNADIRLIDYAQVTAVGDSEGMVQRGSREPFISARDSRGGRSYELNNVGTIVSVKAIPTDGAKVSLLVSFEKSYVESAPVDEEEESTEEATEQAASAQPLNDRGRAALGRGGFFDGRGFVPGGSNLAVTPPSIVTMTINSAVTVTPGQPVVLSESGQWQGDQFDETLILVELKP